MSNVNTDDKKLNARIEAHTKYAKRDLNEWIFENCPIKETDAVLDVGCGTGKQVLPLSKMTKNLIVGVDLNQDSLNQITDSLEETEAKIELVQGEIDKIYEKASTFGPYDVILSSFAIYYGEDREKVLSDLKKMLKPEGKIFLCGPGLQNNEGLLSAHRKLKELPPMKKGYFENFAVDFLKSQFKTVEFVKMENPIEFPTADAVLDYWLSYSIGDESRKDEFKAIVQEVIDKEGKFVTVKEVAGVLAHD